MEQERGGGRGEKEEKEVEDTLQHHAELRCWGSQGHL